MKTSILSTAQADRATRIASELKSRPAEDYIPSLSDRFPSKLASMDQVPEPLRKAVRRRLLPGCATRLILFGPASRVFGKRSPATLLIVTDKAWLMASNTEDGQESVTKCDFANTMLVEFTAVLLRGQLKIDFAAQGRTQFVAAEFNTVMEEYYLEATQMLLDGMRGIATTALSEADDNCGVREPLPLKLQNAILHYQPVGQRLLELVRWPAVFGGKHRWLQREIVPESLLALTNRELLFISEEKSSAWIREKQQAKCGNIVTHCPLSRLTSVKLSEHQLLDTLDLGLSVAQGGEKVKIPFPREQKTEVFRFIERLEEQRGQLV